MTYEGNNLTVKEALGYLDLNGVTYSEVWFRTLVGLGKVKSVKIFNSRVIPKSELVRIVREKKR